jgi:hypothetical protein
VNRKRWQISAVTVAAGIIACIVAWLMSPRAFFLGYLVAAVSVSAIPAGALAVLLLTYLVRGPWTEGLHLPLTTAALTAPLAGLLFLPVLAGLPWIYPWAQKAAGDPVSMKDLYLMPLFYAVRTIIYFALWTVLALWARRAWPILPRMTAVGSVGLIVYALTASLAGIDWLESLTPEFHSSIYGLLFLTFQIIAGLAFALIVALGSPNAPTHRYGAILLAALLLWAYNHAMQYIIIWSGNIPSEVIWYTRRESGVWGLLLWTLIILQFVVPFFAMLSERIRNGRRFLLALAAMTVALRFLEASILALPGDGADIVVLSVAVIGAALLQGSVWSVGFVVLLQRAADSAHDNQALEYSGPPAAAPAS